MLPRLKVNLSLKKSMQHWRVIIAMSAMTAEIAIFMSALISCCVIIIGIAGI